jgi:NADH:ubiquinone oxidoreductase subunit F (NADH-binding)
MSGHETYLLDRTRTAASHTLEVYRASGGYQTIERVLKQPITPLEIIDEMKASGLPQVELHAGPRHRPTSALHGRQRR